MKISHIVAALLIVFTAYTVEASVKDFYRKETKGLLKHGKPLEGNNKGLCYLEPVPPVGEDLIPAAISHYNFLNSETCGMCLEVRKVPKSGEAPPESFKVYVKDACNTCERGGIMLLDGREAEDDYDVLWKAVNCNPSGTKVQYVMQGIDSFYVKVMVRNTPKPITKVSLWDESKSIWVKTQRRVDNFFEGTMTEGAIYPMKIRMVSTDGQTRDDFIPKAGKDWEVMNGEVQFSANGAGFLKPSSLMGLLSVFALLVAFI